jgi:hypothetical protein
VNDTSGKLPGKTLYSGRRRTVTRKSGFKSADGSTGGEYEKLHVPLIAIEPNSPLKISFKIPQVMGQLSGFGAWFLTDSDADINVLAPDSIKLTLEKFPSPNWGKFGSIWTASDDSTVEVEVTFTSTVKNKVSIYAPMCGVIHHSHLDEALENRPVLLKNMYQIAPEGIFLSAAGSVQMSRNDSAGSVELTTKSCNRCARFLPINILDERAHLSFSNHCVAPHRRPCSHSGFGKLQDVNSDDVLKLEYGYQLECRFCKKFEVNAAHNPRRTAGQMKEDGARRRSIELLLSELYGGSPQMLFRHEHGQELSDYVWEKFDRKCFNCSSPIPTARDMHLDHTRPLALLWPLDQSGTCLCGSCNSQKRDRSPSEFYDESQIKRLADKTGIPVEELETPGPNKDALDLLVEKLEWFFDVFLQKPELRKEREGKITGELLVKALQKVINSADGQYPNLQREYESRQI